MKPKNSAGEKRFLQGEHNQCPGCGEYFNSNYAFDFHRIGDHGIDRRCASVQEMETMGMALNKTNWWVSRQKAISDIARLPPRHAETKVGATPATTIITPLNLDPHETQDNPKNT